MIAKHRMSNNILEDSGSIKNISNLGQWGKSSNMNQYPVVKALQLLPDLGVFVLYLLWDEAFKTQSSDWVWQTRVAQHLHSENHLQIEKDALCILGDIACSQRSTEDVHLFNMGWESANDVPCGSRRWDGVWEIKLERGEAWHLVEPTSRSSSEEKRQAGGRRPNDWTSKSYSNLLPQLA